MDGRINRRSMETIRPKGRIKRRRSISTAAIFGSSLIGALGLASCNTAPVSILHPQDAAGYNIIETTTTRGGGRRQRQLQSWTNTNTCKRISSSFHPGEYLFRGEFLCHGNLRLGIDALSGQFILGFASSAIGVGGGSNKNNTTVHGSENADGNGTVFDLDESSDSSNSILSVEESDETALDNTHSITVEHATPSYLAWVGTPTTLFIENDRPFSYITLSTKGNILGYDITGMEIYDSNYDEDYWLESKEAGSILSLSNKCMFMNQVMKHTNSGDEEEEDVVTGEMCITLMSPAMPGMPYGMATWGVTVMPDDIGEMVVSTPVPTETSVPQPTMKPTRARTKPPTTPTTASTSTTTVNVQNTFETPTPSPSNNNIFFTGTPKEEQQQQQNLEPKAIVWGTVWLDSNQNGRMDLGEGTVGNFTVKLFECSDVRSNHVVASGATDSEGMYFFQIPSGRTYRVQFDIDESEYGYSEGLDTDTNMLGWSSCQTASTTGPIQWNAGLYDAEEAGANGLDVASDSMSISGPPVDVMSSIGGFIYLDVDENEKMDSKERTAAVGGYTVNDAVIVVSLTNCQTKEVIETIDVEFPGTYSFSNLTEGLYKLGYIMQVISRATSPEPAPLYSFIVSGKIDEYPTSYETDCGKVGKGGNIDSGNVGLRMQPLDMLPQGSPRPESTNNNLDEIEAMSAPAGAASRAAAPSPEPEGNGTLVGGIVGALVVISMVVFASIIFVKRKRGELTTFPFIGSAKSDRGDGVRSVGSSVLDEDMVSTTPSANQTAIGSLVVEASKSVAASTILGEPVLKGTDDESDDHSYTGMEFALKGSAPGGADSNGDGNSPYQSTLSPSSKSSNNHRAEQMEGEEGSGGYEVYDDGADEEKGHGGATDYGPVISGMIAKYSERQNSLESSGSDKGGEDDDQQEHDESEDFPQSHREGTGNQDWRKYQVQDGYESSGQELALVPHESNADAGQSYQQDDDFQGGYYPNHAHDSTQNNYQQSTDEYGEQFDEQTSTSGSSRSSDPPAASYRDIPAPGAAHAGWDGGHQGSEESYYQQYDASYQYASTDGAYDGHSGPIHYPHDGTYAEGYDPTQYPANNQGTYDGHQYAAHDQYVSNGQSAHAQNYGHNQHANNYQSAHTDTNYEGQENDSDSSSDSSEEASASGWSSSSDTASHASSVSSGASSFNWNRSAAHKAKARRAQSNPRDDRRMASWRDQAAIPENSTVEYNAYTSGAAAFNNRGGTVPTPTKVSDNQSVMSAGSDDPPGASYQNINRQFPPPPPPRRLTPPRQTSPNPNTQRISPNPRRTSPNNQRSSPSSRRGRSVPPPPPRSYPSHLQAQGSAA